MSRENSVADEVIVVIHDGTEKQGNTKGPDHNPDILRKDLQRSLPMTVLFISRSRLTDREATERTSTGRQVN